MYDLAEYKYGGILEYYATLWFERATVRDEGRECMNAER